MTNEQVIESKVNDFIVKNEAFTSVDLANSIKKDGTWIKNRRVASWLRSNFKADDYETTMIDVGGSNGQANLYHPDFFDEMNYDGQNQKAMTPTEFEALHGINPLQTTSGTDDSEEDESDEEEDSLDAEEQDSSITRIVTITMDRIWIPAPIIRKLGWQSGDSVDNHRIGISGNSKLLVHIDGRVSVSKNYWNGTLDNGDKVSISYKDDKIEFLKV